MTWDEAVRRAFQMSAMYEVRYRVYAVRSTEWRRWLWFICPVEGR